VHLPTNDRIATAVSDDGVNGGSGSAAIQVDLGRGGGDAAVSRSNDVEKFRKLVHVFTPA
jgi:hypothetical protein